MAVNGLEKFKEYFSDFNGNYVIIGGTACSIILRDAVMQPRPTKDIDMILIVEEMTPEFGRQFWRFIEDGAYSQRERKRDEGKDPAPELYRFVKPLEGFPYQIELLSKQPEILGIPTGFHLTPIPIGDDIPSLSAILLDEEFYHFALEHSVIDDGLHVADPVGLICLKIKAFLNLSEQDPPAHHDDIIKHMSDVFKLMASAIYNEPVPVPDNIRKDITTFVIRMEELIPNQPLQDSLKRNANFITETLIEMRRIFGIK